MNEGKPEKKTSQRSTDPAEDGSRAHRRVTMREVAELANVSVGTVSRVINNHTSVNEALRERVQKTADAMGFVPDFIAQSMRMRNTKVVGCMVSDVANPLFAEIVGAAEQVLHTSAYNLILASSYNRLDLELEILSLFNRRRLDGLLAGLSSETDERLLEALRSLQIPVVLIERDLLGPMDSVLADHFSGTIQAARYVLSMGHRRIALITVPECTLPGRERAAAFRAAHQAAGIPVDERLICLGSFSRQFGYDAAYRLLLSSSPPTAIMAGAAEMVGVLKVTRLLEIPVPERLSLIVFGDSDLAELHTPPLTAVRWEPARTGQFAANLLLNRLKSENGDPPGRRIKLPTELLVRKSCCPVGTGQKGDAAPATFLPPKD